jgi:hypothetical protein
MIEKNELGSEIRFFSFIAGDLMLYMRRDITQRGRPNELCEASEEMAFRSRRRHSCVVG